MNELAGGLIVGLCVLVALLFATVIASIVLLTCIARLTIGRPEVVDQVVRLAKCFGELAMTLATSVATIFGRQPGLRRTVARRRVGGDDG